ncbi:MAG: hypothetical protein U5P41_12570 [Gammaproteobacteria bacterium]|nr:hypothetical protein [Gammaproteobacteria bacterium]
MKKLLISLLFLPLGFPALAAGGSAGADDSPTGYLEIYKEFDGRCQGLRRGDIRMLRNTHPEKSIEYRLIRLLGDKRQASIIRDTIAPGDEGQKLGCEMLEDREQTWEIVRAQFTD